MIDPNLTIRIAVPGEVQPRRQSKVFKFGSVVIHYQQYRRGRYNYYTLFYYESLFDKDGLFVGRKRIRKTFNTREKAEARAEIVAKYIANGDLAMRQISQADRAEYLAAKKNLAGTDASLVSATDRYKALHKECAGDFDQLQKDAKAGKDLRLSCSRAKDVPDVIDEMLEFKEAGDRWRDDLRSRLKLFRENFTCPIHELRAYVINDWLGRIPGSPRTRNNYKIALFTLFEFAKQKGYIPKSWCEKEDIAGFPEEPKDIQIYSPGEASDLLSAAPDNIAPYMLVAFFCGLRNREIKGDAKRPPLDWKNISFEKRIVYVPKAVAKKGTPDRIVPMSDNLCAWLRPYAKPSGPICTLANVNNALGRVSRKAGVQLIANGFRQSFISYRLSFVKNIAQVAEEAGNSPQVIKSNYKLAVEEPVAMAFWSLRRRDRTQLDFNF
jgi:integrase